MRGQSASRLRYQGKDYTVQHNKHLKVGMFVNFENISDDNSLLLWMLMRFSLLMAGFYTLLYLFIYHLLMLVSKRMLTFDHGQKYNLIGILHLFNKKYFDIYYNWKERQNQLRLLGKCHSWFIELGTLPLLKYTNIADCS